MKYEAIIHELNSLPKGYISKKRIKNKTYNYLQYLENGKIQSEYVSDNNIDEIYSGILRRKELEKLIDSQVNKGKKLPIISNNAKELSGNLMMEDEIVASFEKGILTYINKDKCPLQIKRTSNIKAYLSSRVIDSSRKNSRILKKAMSIKENDDYIISLYAHGAVITDNYWFKTKQSKLMYKDVMFNDDSYADLSLTGNIYFFPKSPRYTPQLTLGGSYEKCWKYENKKWYLYKKGNENEIFSEIFSSELALLLDIPSAKYSYVDGYIKTENFANKYNFEPISSIAGDDDSFEHVFNCLNEYGKEIQKQYLKLIWFDALVNNVDRHNENCGLLRDKKTGKVISLAPNFDNNMSLIARSETLNLDPNKDGFIKLFLSFIKSNNEAYNLLKEIKLPNIKENDIKKIIDNIEIQKGKSIIIKYIINRYKFLISIKNSH